MDAWGPLLVRSVGHLQFSQSFFTQILLSHPEEGLQEFSGCRQKAAIQWLNLNVKSFQGK